MNWITNWSTGNEQETARVVVILQERIKPRFSSHLQDSNSLDLESKPSIGAGSVGKNFNRFSSFVKHGGEKYILGKAEARVRQIDEVRILF